MPAPSEPLALQESKPYWETQKSFGPWAFLFLWASQEMTGGEVPSLTCPATVQIQWNQLNRQPSEEPVHFIQRSSPSSAHRL